MKKITNILLLGIGTIGAFMVGEGLLTGEQLTEIQSLIGFALGGGSLSIALIISIISAIPKQLVSAGYDKAVATYGQAKVDGFINKIDEVMELMQTIDTKLDTLQTGLDEDRDTRNQYLEM